MSKISVDFSKQEGKIKCLNAVNNGPAGNPNAKSQNMSNCDLYKALEFPYARVHDASFFSGYGGEHTVDVNFIFPNFDADVNDPNSYDFDYTDYYMQNILAVGTKPFYRLGSKIEHGFKKYGTLVPKDFKKWAEICEHIIRHLNYGWANGHHFGIEYFEIWNEPDLAIWENSTWSGTREQFFEFYKVVANHLKSCFPELKIGGPAACGEKQWVDDFFSNLDGAPLDFFSWHCYSSSPDFIQKRMFEVKDTLIKFGHDKVESILNEWNFINGWTGDDWIHTIEGEKGLKGSAFAVATMMLGQSAPVDMLMYYDARPCKMNGFFDTDILSKCLKTYYTYLCWVNVKHDGTAVKSKSDTNGIYSIASIGENSKTIMFTRFRDEEKEDDADEDVEIFADNLGDTLNLSYVIVDKDNNAKEYKKQKVAGGHLKTTIKLAPFSTIMLRFTK